MLDGVADKTSVQVGFRAPEETAEALDAWVAEINEGRVVKVSKNAVILSLVAYGLLYRPEWAGKDPPPPETVARKRGGR